MDVVVMTEVQSPFHKLANLPAIRALVKDYVACFWNCATSPGDTYAGTAILCRRNPNSVLFGFHSSLGKDLEGRLITVRFNDCTIVGVYCPAQPDKNCLFLQLLNKHVALEQQFAVTFVVGDMNCPRTDQDISKYSPWIPKINKKTCDQIHMDMPAADKEMFLQNADPWIEARVHLNCLLHDRKLKDLGEDQHQFTWFPEPTTSNQNRQCGMRIDMMLAPVHCVRYATVQVLSHIKGSDHRPLVMDIATSYAQPTPASDAHDADHIANTLQMSQLSLAQEVSYIGQLARSYTDSEPMPTESCYESCEPFGIIQTKTIHDKTTKDAMTGDKSSDLNFETGCPPEDQKGFQLSDASLLKSILFLYNDASTIGIRVRVSVGRSSIICVLVDTGSTFNLLEYNFAKENIHDFKTRFSKRDMAPLTLGDGSMALQPCGIIEDVTLMFERSLGKYKTSSSTFVVIRGLPDLAIIGHDFFLSSHLTKGGRCPNAEISYARQSIRLGHIHIPWAYCDDSRQSSFGSQCKVYKAATNLLYSAQETRLPAQSITQVRAIFRDGQVRGKAWGIFHDISPQDLLAASSPASDIYRQQVTWTCG